MTGLAHAVLPLVRTRADLHRWSAANSHGRQMHQALDILERAIPTTESAEAYSVTHRALASAIKVIARADDSSGIIGDACRRLLDLHPKVAADAKVPAGRLVDWMITFQFDGDVDFFELDPVAYGPALGATGLTTYRERLRDIEMSLGPRPKQVARLSSPHAHARFTLDRIAQRLAVLDHDIDAIIQTHAKDRQVAAWLEDTAEAFEEIGQIDLAIDWARQATDFGHGHQSLKAADYWCRLLERHRPDEAVEARLHVFRRWPSSTTAARLHGAGGNRWADHREEVLSTLATRPDQAVLFALLTLKDVRLAWKLAHSLAVDSDHVWSELLMAYEEVDPLAVLPIHRRLVENELVEAGAQHYRLAARRLARMRELATGSDQAAEIDTLIADLRSTHRRRPRLQQEFDRAGLP